MRYLAILLLCSCCCFAQTKPLKSKALSRCEAALTQASLERNDFRTRMEDFANQLYLMESQKKELEAKNVELSKKIDEFNVAGRDVLAYVQRLEVEYKSLTMVYDAMLAELNHSTAQLEERNAQIAERNTRAMERIAASQEENARINRAMAIFGAWQAMKPPPTPMPTITQPQKLQTNCTSRTVGNTTYTDCN